jgi:DNA-binding CsgD family transcriptional regulator
VPEAIAIIDRARDAAEREAWAEAYELFGMLDRSDMSPTDLAALADAAWWKARRDEAIAARLEAYTGFDHLGDHRGAASAAIRMFFEHFYVGQGAEATGWLMRAQRHLADEPEDIEHGHLAVCWAYMALVRGDAGEAERLGEQAVSIGRDRGSGDLTALALDVQGRAMIAGGRVGHGESLLDEAMTSVVSGELGSFTTGTVYCNVLGACLDIADLRRAIEWGRASASWCETILPEAPFNGFCRIYRVQLAMMRGAWAEAEVEANKAAELLAFSPFALGGAMLLIGELCRRRGDLAGAEDAFVRARGSGFEPQPGLAFLRLMQGKPDVAFSGLRVALTDDSPSPLSRTLLLGAMVQIALAAGEPDAARTACDELDAAAELQDVPAIRAAADTARGAMHLAEGDVDGALRNLRRACATWRELELPYEAAHSQVLYGLAVRAAGDDEGAVAELTSARDAFSRLGAVADAAMTSGYLGDDALPGGLTRRQAEVLRLVAAGKRNREIAESLVISEHTVARHLQDIYAKIGVSSRAGATAFAIEHGIA